ncbi:hypothetical protein BDW02DRAFT_523110 [Decorospora gaudefroyi]|uniref:Uncharacterized protein n=1 Tax=Decorospora gaudefroyi TaxID=184978 RepID=A0A6A5KC12_9PLEO|nr:hypothetical protein BDW02DRAFT_523110 [Decorospora gaudefroyi]
MSHAPGPSSTTAFNALPIELNKAIVHQLETDKDIATYRLICPATNDAIDADRLSFWRTKFREQYAFKESLSNARMQQLYQRRSKLLRHGTRYDFFHGYEKHEAYVVRMLRDLIVESFQGTTDVDEHGRPRCKNQTHLMNFIRNSRLLMDDRRPPQGPVSSVHETLLAVKLMCSQFIFDLSGLEHNIFAFEESQYAVYRSSIAAPLFTGTNVNMEWIMHCMKFFRHHMMNEEAQTLFDKIQELDVSQKPSAWREPLRQGAYPLSKYWKGTYSFLDNKEVMRLRCQGPGEEVYIDKNVDEGKIQLNFAENSRLPDGRKLSWPDVFEDRLHSLGNAAAKQSIKTQGRNTAKTTDNIHFEGRGEDLEDDYNALGWLNPLPAQAGIPGWQRITFMKHFMDDFAEPEEDNLWAYEGVVLPGGRIIVGRWWYASSDYNGPFILWAVDGNPEFEDDDTCDGDTTEEE